VAQEGPQAVQATWRWSQPTGCRRMARRTTGAAVVTTTSMATTTTTVGVGSRARAVEGRSGEGHPPGGRSRDPRDLPSGVGVVESCHGVGGGGGRSREFLE
jgi:hypothetical protein